MAITNKQLLAQYKTKNNVPLDLPMYTAGAWYNKGYKIKRGEKCKHRVMLWANCKSKIKAAQEQDGQEQKQKKSSHAYMKTACLFELNQVEKMAGK